MTKKTFQQFAAVVALFALVFATSACNRGYGCPNNFKAGVAAVVQLAK